MKQGFGLCQGFRGRASVSCCHNFSNSWPRISLVTCAYFLKMFFAGSSWTLCLPPLSNKCRWFAGPKCCSPSLSEMARLNDDRRFKVIIVVSCLRYGWASMWLISDPLSTIRAMSQEARPLYTWWENVKRKTLKRASGSLGVTSCRPVQCCLLQPRYNQPVTFTNTAREHITLTLLT